ncbi:NADH dehydrogenase [Shewanella sp. NFH-SH190041]|uniref:NAD(P)/FAD-dependent oxidoreductase n=1 Tax=Shewanella sp. NFH-SH190041 TaxID=2950245 RepID=UPI0021C407F6|nr:NAD(P)/FAD-dependent oxidoreductase [Shewanella sp. NFH-SH190041]BDM66208.1 NADH dehydrogenase [Shewanella sp. NFH-SH190041]
MSRIVVVGGGAAGLELTTLLAAQFKKTGHHQVILVEPESHHYWKPRFHEVAAGSFDSELDAICYFSHSAKQGYQHLQARMTGLNRTQKQIELHSTLDGTSQLLSYDLLVMATGAISNDFGTQGVTEHCLFLDTPQQALQSQQQINTLLRSGGRRTVNIVGAGATGVELAAELAEVSRSLTQHPHAAELSINLIEAADRVLPHNPPAMSRKAEQRLLSYGINVLTSTRISQVDTDGMTTATNRSLPAQLQFWAAGIKAPQWLTQLDGLATNRINQLQVKPTLQTTLDDAIFALGDCAEIPQPDGTMVPPKAQSANRAALHLAKTLPGFLRGEPLTEFIFKDAGMFVAMGHHYAISTTMNNRLILQGELMRTLYNTIFRLHQKTVSGILTVLRLMITKQLKRVFMPGSM